VVREVQAAIGGDSFDSPATARFVAWWRDHAAQIEGILARAEALGRALQGKTFEHVLCHADIHAANILVDTAGQIHLVDWDWPLIAPRERDLLFVVGSQVGRPVQPPEEAHFFAGYGPVEIDPLAITYYRYERIIEDIGDIGKNVMLAAGVSELMREDGAAMAMGLFAPGGMIETAEIVSPNQGRARS
jgi:spectinomycin phosphotransferase